MSRIALPIYIALAYAIVLFEVLGVLDQLASRQFSEYRQHFYEIYKIVCFAALDFGYCNIVLLFI